MATLFDPIKIGELELANRIIMAPLTRCRDEGRVPNALMAEYTQRASAGLIISEATSVTRWASATPTPRHLERRAGQGLEQHHQGRARQRRQDRPAAVARGPHLRPQLPGRRNPGRPSAIAAKGHVSLLRPLRDYPVPRALETEEIGDIIEAYRVGAENAQAAGFDGVELHAANGYLIDQFLQDSTNKRTDLYGGSLENRARLLLEVTDALIKVWGAGRVGVHLAPRADSHDMGDSNRAETFGYVARELGKRGVAFICAREKVADDSLTRA